MKTKYFLSLNAKIFFFLFLSFSCILTVFLSTFMLNYVRQLDQEAISVREKAKALYELYDENMALREIVSDRYRKEDVEGNSFTNLWNDQEKKFSLKPLDDRRLALRQELLKDMKGSRERDNKVRLLGYFMLSAFILVFLVLELLWLIIRRWILLPIGKLVDATHHIASGDLSFRLPVAEKMTKTDELDILAREFNKMSEDIETYVREVSKNKEFLQNLIDNIPDGIRVLDENHNIMLTNSAYDKIYQNVDGKKRKKCFEAYGNTAPCQSSQHPCTLALLKEHPEQPVTVIQHYTDREGREKYVEVSAAATFHQVDGKTVFWVIEMVRPLDKAILFSHQQKLSALGMLASSVAHEMRNPLGSVRLILENVLDKMQKSSVPKKDLEHYLSLVSDQISFCINVTSRLLKLSRKPEKEEHPVDLNEVVTETAGLLEYEAKKTGVEITIRESEKPAVIAAADAEMRMVVVNLMQNAFHAMPDGGKMDISVCAENGRVTVNFVDTGAGIAPNDLSRIFEPFFSKGVEQGKNEGTGLGLSIVKTIIENHKGVISVESELGKGTTFRLDFEQLKE